MKDLESGERLTQARELFEEVSALPVNERSSFLDQACGEDMDLHREITSLLTEAGSDDSPVEDLVNGVIWPALESLNSEPSILQGWMDDLPGAHEGEEDQLVGKTVSRFEILAPIGRGGMGMVYRAHDRTLDRTVALKFLPPSLNSDQGAKDRFIHEAKAASGLNHPNIATIHDIGETEDQQMFIAMGYYPGETLKEKIGKGPISPDTSIDIAIQLASGMKAAHGHGVIHRDIKPGNIMITAEGTVVLLDFGLAKLSHETGYTQLGQMAGTIAYMSPEQARSETIDERTDFWAFGVVLYEMLTGKRPFGGDNAQSVIRAILEDDPEPPVVAEGEIPDSLKTILGLCLAKNPDHRYQRAEDLLEDLRRAQEGLAPLKRGGRATWNRRLRRRRWAIIGVGVAIPTLIFGVVSTTLYFSARESALVEQPTATPKSIAVLPFENLSDREEDVFFIKGIHADLLSQISRIRDIKTISRTSVMTYQGATKNMKSISEELGVATILEGGFQRSGNSVRINVKLTDTATNALRWSETYDRELTVENIFEIQSEIAMAIAKALQAKLSPEEKEHIERLPTQNLAALEAYYRGMEKQKERTASSLEVAVDHFEEAISLDPDFAKAHAMLGQTLILQFNFVGLPLDLQIAKGEPHIQRALELDDTSSEAYSALGYLRRRQGDYEGSKLAYKKAIELDPDNAVTHSAYANLLISYIGEASEGARMARKAYDLDPKHNLAPSRLARSLEWSGQLDEAQELRESTAAENPENSTAQVNLGEFYLRYIGRFDDAIEAFRKAYFLDPKGRQSPARISYAYHRLGDWEQEVWWIERHLRLQQDPKWRIGWRAWILKLNGDNDAREQIALEGLRQYPKFGQVLYHLTDLDIASGQPEKSRARWELAYPSLFEPSVKLFGSPTPYRDGNNVWRAKDLARVLVAMGEREQANCLIAEALTATRSTVTRLDTLRLEAMLHAIGGDERQTLAAISRFLNAGGSPYHLMFEDELKPFQENPEYQEMAAEAEARMAGQLKRIRDMEANGELAPIPELPAY